MRKYIKSTTTFLMSICLLILAGCTDLDETIYSELNKQNFYNNRLEVMQGALRPFTHMQAWLVPTWRGNYWYHNELSGDQQAWPQKGKHGYDGGDHFRMHYHTWTPEEGRLADTWALMWSGVGLINSAIEDLSGVEYQSMGITDEEMNAIIAELHVLRAFHYIKLMDLWGNIPIVTKVADPLNPETKPSAEVFAFIEEELTTYVPDLLPYSEELIGRVSATAGYAMLAELYLNAEVWAGEPMYDKCIQACNKIIDGEAGGLNGGPSLAPDIFESFGNTNQTARENLFQFAYSRKGGFEFIWQYLFSGYGNMSAALNVSYSGWNAVVVTPTGFDLFEDNDLRKQEWFLSGPQYVYGTEDPILGTEEYADQPLVYVNAIRRESEGDFTSEGGMAEGEENSGARFHKYRSGTVDEESYRENHYIIYRLTEIYFNKAEAIMRQNGGVATPEAVDLINACRQRAFDAADWPAEAYTVATLTLDELYRERGREFVFEGKRRTDMIRFEKFITTDWWDHSAHSDPNKELFPIPARQIAINPNLKQNPGYLSE